MTETQNVQLAGRWIGTKMEFDGHTRSSHRCDDVMRWMDAVGIASGCGGSDAIDAINNAKNDAKLFAIILRSGLLCN